MSIAKFVLMIGASFVGVVAGHSIVRSILGTGRTEPSIQQPGPPVPCQSESQQLGQCIDYASQDISKCQVYMDLLVSCQQRQKY